MKSYLDNLRPFEKRLVVGVAVMLFVVLNVAFVLPHFSDWNRVQNRMADAQWTLEKFIKEIEQIPAYTNQINSHLTRPVDPAADQRHRRVERNRKPKQLTQEVLRQVEPRHVCHLVPDRRGQHVFRRPGQQGFGKNDGRAPQARGDRTLDTRRREQFHRAQAEGRFGALPDRRRERRGIGGCCAAPDFHRPQAGRQQSRQAEGQE